MREDSSWFRRIRNHNDVRAFLAFFGASAAGLAVDLIGFQLLLMVGLSPWMANAISSVCSITLVYVLATRHAFGTSMTAWTYAAFVTWYGLSILTFSALIQFASVASGEHPFLWKLLSVPVSFVLNYAFSRFLFRDRKR